MNTSHEFIEGHIVVFGWSPRVIRILRELRSEVHHESDDMRPIVVVAPTVEDTTGLQLERVYFIHGQPNDLNVLGRANLNKAHSVLIPSYVSEDAYSDGETVFALLAALAVNANLRACVEIASAQNGETLSQIHQYNLQHGDVEIVSFESVSERLLAQAAINPGVTRVYSHLLSFSETTNEIYTCALGSSWKGKSFRALASECFDRDITLLGYELDGELALNPKNRDYKFAGSENIWFIALNKATGLKVINS